MKRAITNDFVRQDIYPANYEGRVSRYPRLSDAHIRAKLRSITLMIIRNTISIHIINDFYNLDSDFLSKS